MGNCICPIKEKELEIKETNFQEISYFHFEKSNNLNEGFGFQNAN